MLAAGVLSAAVLSGGVFALSASAQTSSNGNDSLASKIASKFNLNKEEVQSVLNEHHAEMHTAHMQEHLERHEERLNKAVQAGELTEEQKTKILEYLKSQESNLENLEDKTKEERQAAMKTHREEMKKWAADNGIDEKYVLPMGGPGPGHGHGHMKGGEGREESDN